MTKENFEHPLLVTPESSHLSIQEVEFPGVAICNVNKISKKRATELANFLKKIYKNNDFSNILEDIQLMGNLYDNNMYDHGRQLEFQDLLDDIDNTTDFDDPKQRMRDLISPCEDMLKECVWAGEKYNCSELFKSRMTYDGICCTFNYIKPFKKTLGQDGFSEEPPSEPMRPLGTGIENGLKVKLINNIDDYFFSTLETTGYTIKIFHPRDFPDQLSGSLSDVIVNFGEEILLSIDVTVVKSSNFIKALPYNLRSCIFENEETTVFGKYRHSDCMVDCRLRIMNTLCGCIPITFAAVDLDKIGDLSYCSLVDLPCLSEHRTKWLKYYPNKIKSTDLDKEKQDSMKCECYPTCNNIVYKVSANSAPLFLHGNNYSYLNIYFERPFVNLYKMDLSQTWYDMISNVGGFLSLFMGMSIISAIEVLILIYRLARHCISRINQKYFH